MFFFFYFKCFYIFIIIFFFFLFQRKLDLPFHLNFHMNCMLRYKWNAKSYFALKSNNDTKECIYFCGRLKFLILWFGIMTWIHLHCTMYNCLCFYIKIENKTKTTKPLVHSKKWVYCEPSHTPPPSTHTQTHTLTHTTTTSPTNIMPINISHCDEV